MWCAIHVVLSCGHFVLLTKTKRRPCDKATTPGPDMPSQVRVCIIYYIMLSSVYRKVFVLHKTAYGSLNWFVIKSVIFIHSYNLAYLQKAKESLKLGCPVRANISEILRVVSPCVSFKTILISIEATFVCLFV